MKDPVDPGTLDLEDWLSKSRRPRAIGAYIFAGGFTLGVKEHFDVACHLEESNYGVATVRRNMPELPVYFGRERWPLEELKKHEWDFIMGNPPCSVWSSAGAVTTKKRSWADAPLLSCTREHFSLLEKLRPRFWAWESVQQAWKVGEEFVRSLAESARSIGYSTTVLLHNSEYLGVPQRRRRFFMVCHDVEFDPRPPSFEPGGTLEEAIRGMNDRGEPLEHNIGRVRRLLPEMKQGEDLRRTWERMTPESDRVVGARGQVVGRPPFTIKRAKSGEPSFVVMHETVHPTEDRGLSIKELAVLCGYPPSYEFVGAKDAGQVGRGVCPPVGEYLAREVAHALKNNRKEASPTIKVVDYTGPPGRVTQLSWREEAAATTVVEEATGMSEQEAGEAEAAYPSPGAAPQVRDVRPKEGLKSGAYIRLLLSMGAYSPDQIVEMVRRHYPESKATKNDVNYHKYKMRRESIAVPDWRQPTRAGERLSNDADRIFDKSSLRAASHGQWVHRDYGAHFFRWGFAGRFVNNEVEVLDVGCGPDVPMINALTMPRSNVPKRYVGVDLNRAPRKAPSRQWATLYWEFNFLDNYSKLGQFDLVTCFEAIEHMRREDGERLLDGLRACVRPGGMILLSTPVYNGKAAADHLHEWQVEELSDAIGGAGLNIINRFGTFASFNEIKKVASVEHLAAAKALSGYYSGEVVACFLAPLYPDASRNCCWVLERSS